MKSSMKPNCFRKANYLVPSFNRNESQSHSVAVSSVSPVCLCCFFYNNNNNNNKKRQYFLGYFFMYFFQNKGETWKAKSKVFFWDL